MPVMPDTRIPLSGLSGESHQSTSPFQTLGAMMQIKEQQQQYEARRQEMEKRRRDLEDDDEMSKALQQYERPEEAIDHLWKTGRSSAAAALSKDVLGARTAKWQEADAELKLQGTRIGQAAQLLGSVKDDASYQTVRGQVAKIIEPLYGPAINDHLPTVYGDGVQVSALVNAGTTRAEQIQGQRDLIARHQKAYEDGLMSATQLGTLHPDLKILGPDGKPNAGVADWSKAKLDSDQAHQENLARELLTATNKDGWDTILKTAYENGVPLDVIGKFRGWNDNAQARAEMLGLSLPQRVAAKTAARNADRYEDAEAARQQRADDAAIRADRRERRLAGGAETRGQLTDTQRNKEADDLDKDVAATEKWVNDQAGYSKEFNYQELSPSLKKEYIRRRVEIEDKRRTRLQGVKPIAEAAKEAVANKDSATYDKLEAVYDGITNQLGKIGDIAPWPDRDAGVNTPAAAARRRTDVADILQKLKDPALTPAARKALETRYKQLMPTANPPR